MPAINVSCHTGRSNIAHDLQVTLKDGASADQLDKAKSDVKSQGGKITKEFKLIKGFTYVDFIHSSQRVWLMTCSAEFPEDSTHTLSTNEHIDVEADSEVKTQ